MATILTGAAFGAAMVAAGVHDPAVLISQFKFDNFDMLQSFLAASATTRYLPLHPPQPPRPTPSKKTKQTDKPPAS